MKAWHRRDSQFGATVIMIACAQSLLHAASAAAQPCQSPGGCTGDLSSGMCGISTTPIETGVGCDGSNNCQDPEISADPTFEIVPRPVTVDGVPHFSVRMVLQVRSPWNIWARQNNVNGQLQALWVDPASRVSVCNSNLADLSKIWVERSMTCAEMWDTRGGSANPSAPSYDLTVATCGPPCDPDDPGCFTNRCHKWDQQKDIAFSIPDEMLAEVCPRKECPENTCCPPPPAASGPPGGGLGGGGGWGTGGPSSDDGAGDGLGRAGDSFMATKAGPNPTMGRYWSHAFGERIIEREESPSHVWLFTADALYQEFWDVDRDGTFDKASPSHVEDALTRTAIGWQLRSLNGTIREFNVSGQWVATRDRNGNTAAGTYSGGRLQHVDLPDGRRLDYAYHADGLLASITEVGVGATMSRAWSYTWSGLDLVRIDRPDGTAWLFRYDDPANPGYVTRRTLRGTDGSLRIYAAREYDVYGNLVKKWRGAVSPTGPEATEVFSYSYTRPWNPIERQETDPLNNLSRRSYLRDPDSNLALTTSTSGGCASCGAGPNIRQFYDDSDNPTRVTRSIDADGTVTLFEYDGNGQLISRTEAMGADLERTTTWEYDATYPDLVTAIELPSASGSGVRRTTWTYDELGNATVQTEEGVESGSAYSYSTVMTYNGAGQPESIDPPGNGSRNRTLLTYDASRGNLFAMTRTDPLVGATRFDYDPFNRMTSTTDVNGVTSLRTFDSMGRVLTVTRQGAAVADDLVTTITYTPHGDRHRMILPEGNIIEYDYDSVGRLISIEQKPDISSSGDRTFFELNDSGQIIRQDLQSWESGTWVSRKSSEFIYPTRCDLERIVHADGSVTEFAYDCNGRLKSEWDPNNPSGGQVQPPSRSYAYDDLDRVITVTQPWGGGGGGNVIMHFGYDSLDHLVEIADGNGTTSRYVFSDRDLLTEEVSEVSGTTLYTYDETGRMVRETDSRGVTVELTVDAAGRIVFVDYPEDHLDTLQVYDDPAVAFSKGRLTAIVRDGRSIDYRYDRFGRRTQDGVLSYGYDRNGNRTTLGYPGGVTATTTYDFADRPASLRFDDGSGSERTLVSAASYLPSGPLSSLTMGNGLTETRTFTNRYFPARTTVPGRLDWVYSTDAIGNVTGIADALDAARSRTFGFQDHQYYLNSGNGPWGALSWTYDRIGNRLTETRDGVTSTYSYLPNAAGNSSPRLSAVTDGVGEVTRYVYDSAGTLTHENRDSAKIRYRSDAAMRLSQINTDAADRRPSVTGLRYDGRGLLARSLLTSASGGSEPWQTTPTYSSEGVLYHRAIERYPPELSPRLSPAVTGEDYVLYFAGRPVAIFAVRISTLPAEAPSATSEISYLTTDHLGTPVLVTGESADLIWSGGFEPFGRDYTDAQSQGVFLRFPGQWQDGSWEDRAGSTTLYYNVMRWFQPSHGRYSRQEPVLIRRAEHHYLYAANRPLSAVDPLGLQPSLSGPRAMTPAFGDRPCHTIPKTGPKTCCDIEALIEALTDAMAQWKSTCSAAHGTGPAGPRGSGAGTGGGTYVQVGGMVPEAWINPTLIGGSGGSNPCVNDCACTHERRHEWQSGMGRSTVVYWSLPLSECDAYGKEVECLLKALSDRQ